MASVYTGELQTKSIITTVLKKCIEEKNNNNVTIPINNVQERVAFYTGIPKNFIIELYDDLQTDQSEHSLSFRHRVLIMKGLLHFYGDKKMPTVNEVYDRLLKATKLPHIAQFTKEMTNFGYCYRKTTNGYLLMEDPACVFERYHYLKKILKFRNNNVTVHYLDERVIDQHCTFQKPTRNMNEKTIPESLLYCYLVSRDGLVEGMFCNYINRDEIMNWMKYILIPNLEPSSVIVTSSNFLYEQNTNKSPSPYASKDTMVKWLTTNNIPCNTNMHKADLHALITKLPPSVEYHNVDHLFKAHGHVVLRLPTCLQDLNPTENVWQDMKLALQDKIPEDLFTLKEYVHNYIKSVLPLVHNWPEYERKVNEFENLIFEIDGQMGNVLDSYNFETDNPLFECQLSRSEHSAIDVKLE